VNIPPSCYSIVNGRRVLKRLVTKEVNPFMALDGHFFDGPRMVWFTLTLEETER